MQIDRTTNRQTTIMVTRPRQQAGELCELLEQRGAAAYVFSTIEIQPIQDYAPIDALLQQPQGVDWLVMTSANGVAMLQQRASILGLSLSSRFAGTRVAAIGPRTAQALLDTGLKVELVPPAHVAESLAEALIATGISGRRVLTLRSEIAREALIERLQAAGAEVVDLPIYTTVLPTSSDIDAARAALKAGRIDWVSFTSASAARNFAACFADAPDLLTQVRIACIGPVTAKTAKGLFGHVDFEASHASMQALADGMMPLSASALGIAEPVA